MRMAAVNPSFHWLVTTWVQVRLVAAVDEAARELAIGATLERALELGATLALELATGATELAREDAGAMLDALRELGATELGATELPVPLKLGHPIVILLASAPDAVNCDVAQLPVGLAPGTTAEAPSALSFNDQLALLMLWVFIKLTHALVSLLATAPLPSAFTEPHSVTKSAAPLFSAVVALSRKDCPWVPA